jgi:type VI protein secretion system component VasF
VVLEIRDPGAMARTLELELVRFEHARLLVRMPAGLEELAQTLTRIAEMLRVAERRGQAVDLGDEVVRLIERFRGALRAVGGEPAQA